MTLKCVKLIVGLLSAPACTELLARLSQGKSSISVALDFKEVVWSKMSEQVSQAEGDNDDKDDDHHHHHHDHHHHDGYWHKHHGEGKPHFHGKHGHGHGWHHHEGGPEKWLNFLQEKCEQMKPIMECHKSCFATGGGHACHVACPLPKCPKGAEKAKEVLKCHEKCGEDRECHHNCPQPLRTFAKKCEVANEIVACRKKCAGGVEKPTLDEKCLEACPDFKSAFNNLDDDEEGKGFGKGFSWKGKGKGKGKFKFVKDFKGDGKGKGKGKAVHEPDMVVIDHSLTVV